MLRILRHHFFYTSIIESMTYEYNTYVELIVCVQLYGTRDFLEFCSCVYITDGYKAKTVQKYSTKLKVNNGTGVDISLFLSTIDVTYNYEG